MSNIITLRDAPAVFITHNDTTTLHEERGVSVDLDIVSSVHGRIEAAYPNGGLVIEFPGHIAVADTRFLSPTVGRIEVECQQSAIDAVVRVLRGIDDIESLSALGNSVRLLPHAVDPASPHDGSHSMDELYDQRMLSQALFASGVPMSATKSWRHHDGELCFGGGWFVVYFSLSSGQVSNHYPARDWELFDVPEVACAPEWDGHDPAEANRRMRAAIVAHRAGR